MGDFGKSEASSEQENKNDVQASENLKKQDVLSSKYPELDIEETTYWPEKRPYWNIKNTPKVSEYNSALKSRELKTDEIEIKPMENIEDSHMNQDIKPKSVRSKVKTIKDDEDLTKEPQIHSSEREKES